MVRIFLDQLPFLHTYMFTYYSFILSDTKLIKIYRLQDGRNFAVENLLKHHFAKNIKNEPAKSELGEDWGSAGNQS